MAQTKRHTEHAWSFFTAAARQAARERQVIDLRPHFAYQNGMRSQKPFRMTSLREIDLQPSWNDILTKNIGGGGVYHFLTIQFGPPPNPTSRLARKFTDLKLRTADMDAQGIAMQAISLTAPMVSVAAQDGAGWHGGAHPEVMTAAARLPSYAQGFRPSSYANQGIVCWPI